MSTRSQSFVIILCLPNEDLGTRNNRWAECFRLTFQWRVGVGIERQSCFPHGDTSACDWAHHHSDSCYHHFGIKMSSKDTLASYPHLSSTCTSLPVTRPTAFWKVEPNTKCRFNFSMVRRPNRVITLFKMAYQISISSFVHLQSMCDIWFCISWPM
jgi:hypothetical protein